MSTVTQPRTTGRPAPALRTSLQQPLLRLQSAIRRYVTFESIAYLVMACFVWAVGWLLFDWGVLFRLFGFDYLREGGTTIQGILRVGAILILAAVGGWIIVRYLLMRLMKPITTSDLALAIERRFG